MAVGGKPGPGEYGPLPHRLNYFARLPIPLVTAPWTLVRGAVHDGDKTAKSMFQVTKLTPPPNERKPYELHEERRAFPRIAVDIAVDIRYKGQQLSATIRDVSPDGLQLRCSRETILAIHPSGTYITKKNAPVLDMRFTLLVGGEERLIHAACYIYYFTLLTGDDEHDVACGCQFRVFEGKCKQYLDQYVQDIITLPAPAVVEVEPPPVVDNGKDIEPAPESVAAADPAEAPDTGGMQGMDATEWQAGVTGSLNLILDRLDALERRIVGLQR